MTGLQTTDAGVTPADGEDLPASETGPPPPPSGVETREGRPRLPRSAVVSGLLLRVALAPFTSWPHDVFVWYQVALSGQRQGGLYERSQFPYPPLWGFLLQGVGQGLGLLGLVGTKLGTASPELISLNQASGQSSNVVTSLAFNLAFKVILIALDLAVGYLIFRLVMDLTGDVPRAQLAFGLWFLNPLVLFESSVFGGFDVMVGLFAIAGVILLFERSYFWAGLALSLGILTKASPIFLVPIFGLVAAEVTWIEGRIRMAWRNVALLAVGGITPFALLAPPAVAGGGDAVNAIASRAQVGFGVGGLGFLGLAQFRSFSGIATFASRHSGLVINATTALALAGAALGALLGARWCRRDRIYGICGGSLITMSALLLTQPVTQPQYVLWLLPLLVVWLVVEHRTWWQLGLLSSLPVIYVYSFFGPYAVLAPLAQSTNLMDLETIRSKSIAWFTRPTGLWGTDYGSNFRSIASVGCTIALLAIVVQVVRGAPRRVSADARRMGPPRRTSYAVTPLVIVLALAVLGAVAAARPWPIPNSRPSLTVLSATRAPAGTKIAVRVSPGAGQTTIRLVAFPLAQLSPDRKISVFFDPDYPGPDSDPRAVKGVFDHLSAELASRGDRRKVTIEDAETLAGTFRDLGEARMTTIVMTSGVMPALIFSESTDLVTPWLRAGGELIWSGDQIGYYSESATRVFDPEDPSSRRDAGPLKILGAPILEPGRVNGRTGNRATPVAQALGLRLANTEVGVSLGKSQRVGAKALGYTGDGLSSITRVPVGSGSVLLLGSNTYDEELIAHDLWRIILSHVTDRAGRIAYRDIRAPRTGSRSVQWLAGITTSPGQQVMVLAFDPEAEGIAFNSEVINAR